MGEDRPEPPLRLSDGHHFVTPIRADEPAIPINAKIGVEFAHLVAERHRDQVCREPLDIKMMRRILRRPLDRRHDDLGMGWSWEDHFTPLRELETVERLHFARRRVQSVLQFIVVKFRTVSHIRGDSLPCFGYHERQRDLLAQIRCEEFIGQRGNGRIPPAFTTCDQSRLEFRVNPRPLDISDSCGRLTRHYAPVLTLSRDSIR
jgi:hypothetical protein